MEDLWNFVDAKDLTQSWQQQSDGKKGETHSSPRTHRKMHTASAMENLIRSEQQNPKRQRKAMNLTHVHLSTINRLPKYRTI